MTVEGTQRGSSWREYTDQGLSKVLAAALAAFVEKGYDGASIREIASRAGLSVPGLYHHYPSKQALLVGLTNAVMRELLDRSHAAVAEAGPTPGERFDAVIESLLRFHMYRREQAFVASRETRSMEPESRKAYIALRDEQQEMLDDIVREGGGGGGCSGRRSRRTRAVPSSRCASRCPPGTGRTGRCRPTNWSSGTWRSRGARSARPTES